MGENSKMKKILPLLAALLLLTYSAQAEQPITGEVRSSSGRLIYKTLTRGNQTEVRSPTGRLLIKSETTGGKTEVRSPSGKLLYKMK